VAITISLTSAPGDGIQADGGKPERILLFLVHQVTVAWTTVTTEGGNVPRAMSS
jgi:hypothetical protein